MANTRVERVTTDTLQNTNFDFKIRELDNCLKLLFIVTVCMTLDFECYTNTVVIKRTYVSINNLTQV